MYWNICSSWLSGNFDTTVERNKFSDTTAKWNMICPGLVRGDFQCMCLIPTRTCNRSFYLEVPSEHTGKTITCLNGKNQLCTAQVTVGYRDESNNFFVAMRSLLDGELFYMPNSWFEIRLNQQIIDTTAERDQRVLQQAAQTEQSEARGICPDHKRFQRWDFEEEKVLAAAVRKHGRKWELVANEMNTDRTPRMLYERWRERGSEILANVEPERN